MPSIAEVFKEELLARLQATPLSTYGPEPPLSDRIRRSHLTHVNRDDSPAIYVRFGKATKADDRSCSWRWELEWTVSVYVRSDNDADSDPIVIEAVARINPYATPYQNNAVLDIDSIESEIEVADGDAQRVDISGTAKLHTQAWSLL
jgi:hypothetical protein